MNLVAEILGIIGGIIILIAYYLVSSRKILGDSAIYNGLVLISCALYFIYAILLSAWSVIFLEILFISFSLRALYKCYRGFLRRRSLKKNFLTEAEAKELADQMRNEYDEVIVRQNPDGSWAAMGLVYIAPY